jgi:hypothetical protein
MYDITEDYCPFFFLMRSLHLVPYFHMYQCCYQILDSNWLDPAKIRSISSLDSFSLPSHHLPLKEKFHAYSSIKPMKHQNLSRGVVHNTWSPTVAVYMIQVLMHSVPPNNEVYSVDPSVRRKARCTCISEWWQIACQSCSEVQFLKT